MEVLLLSTYELGHQPLAVARPAAHLIAAGHRVRCQDLAVDTLDEDLVRSAELIGISVPMHTATRLGARLAERVRALNPAAHICFYGLYASLHADVLLGRLADSALGGEFEGPLVALADRLAARNKPTPALVETSFERQLFLLPRRDLLPPLKRYARVVVGELHKLVGYVEASRGCAHQCLHCPITPVYNGRLRIVQQDIVLEDIRQLVRMGAEHITFGDPDFFNGIRHSLRIVDALHDEFPRLTYDVTIKVEHLLEHRAHVPTLARTGCLFIVSAVEAVQDHILANFHKGHTGLDVVEALRIADEAGIPLRPTFVPFTPWASLDDYLGLLRFIREHGLERHVDAVQYAIRLLVPRGSSLVGTPAMDPFLGQFDAQTFSHTWQHPDARMDLLHAEVGRLVERALREGQEPEVVLSRVLDLARAASGQTSGAEATTTALSQASEPEAVGNGSTRGSKPVPRLTEPWFC